MRFLKPIVSVLMAVMISITSLGVAVSSHACTESGFSESSIGHLKACCKMAEGDGFRAVPCCKVNVQHVKLPTVRTAATSIDFGLQKVVSIAIVLPLANDILQNGALSLILQGHPPEPPPALTGRQTQVLHCSFLI
jgi:hypothetical protein